MPIGVYPPTAVPPQAVTDAQGEARATVTTSSRAGTHEIVALVGPDAGPAEARFAVTSLSGPVARVEPLTSTSGLCPVAGGVASPPWGVIVFDAYQNPVPGVRVEFEVPGDGFPTPDVVLTDALGGATTRWTVRTRVGRDTMYARIPSIGYEIRLTTSVCPAAPARVVVYTNGVEADTARLAVGARQPMHILRFDRYGNSVPFQVWEAFQWESLDPTVATANGVMVEGVSAGTTRV